MISGLWTQKQRMSSLLVAARRWAGRGCLVAGLVGSLASCEDATDLGTELPPADNITGTIYIDTLTVRTSTVLVDSVPTSTSNYLLLGRYTDARLGAVMARSYAQVGLTGVAFQPEATAVYDSLVLVLQPDTYRYGDTTRTQQLRVHRLREAQRPGTTYYAFNTLSYDATSLGTRSFRARAGTAAVRVRLSDALGRELFTAGQNRQLSTTDELTARLPGLALVPGATDDAAILRFDATNEATTMQLYYHEPSDPTTALLYSFTTASAARHFYQLQATRNGTLLSSLTATRQALPSASTAAEAYIQGGLGLQTKVEIPYLLDLKALTGTWVVNSAGLTLEVVTATENRYFSPPASLTVHVADRGNRSQGLLTDQSGNQVTAIYGRGVSSRTNLDQGSYGFSLTAYCTAVLNRQVSNQGLLLAPQSLVTPERVILGGSGNATHPPRFIIYMTRVL